MRTITYGGTITARTSIAHGGNPSGITHTFRRETIIRPDGRRLPGVPVISGGTVKGALRRLASRMTQQALVGDERLPFEAVHAQRTGGSLRETKTSGEVLTGERQARLRDLIPMFGLFGVSGGGRVMSGRLLVDKPIPVARETAHLGKHYEVDLDGYDLPSIWQTIQTETYTRLADINDAVTHPWVEDDPETQRHLDKGSGSMLWEVETIVPGTRLWHTIQAEDVTALEADFFRDLIRLWSRRAHIGGHAARGHGKVTCDYTEYITDVWGEPAEAEEADWRHTLHEHHDEALEALSWL